MPSGPLSRKRRALTAGRSRTTDSVTPVSVGTSTRIGTYTFLRRRSPPLSNDCPRQCARPLRCAVESRDAYDTLSRGPAATSRAGPRRKYLYVYLVAAVAAISGLLFGFDIAVINGAIIFIREQFGLTEVQTEFAASSLLVGCVLGASVGGVLSDRFGRRRTLAVFGAAVRGLIGGRRAAARRSRSLRWRGSWEASPSASLPCWRRSTSPKWRRRGSAGAWWD